MADVRIEASREQLEEIRQYLQREMGEELDLQEISAIRPGELGEPVLISLVVALGGPVLVRQFVSLMKSWLKHRERMKKMDIGFKLALIRDGKVQPVTLDELS